MPNYKDEVKLSYKVLRVGINKKKVTISLMAYFINPKKLDIANQRLVLADGISKEVKCKVYDKKQSVKNALMNNRIQTVTFDVKELIEQDIPINNHLKIVAEIEGEEVLFYIGKPCAKKNFNERYYYVPYKAVMLDNYALHFRREPKGILILVKRPVEAYEKTWKYKLMENKVVSCLMYYAGKQVRSISDKEVFLMYEKFSGKAEEGTYELFCRLKEIGKGNYFFIIDKNWADYEGIKDEPGVVSKYSIKYYWLIYRVNMCIATEAPSHLNVMRSNNKWLRRANIDTKFFFLQHGVTYLKRHSKKSTFVSGREGAPDYIIVNSEKEKNVVKEMLNLKEEQIFNVGMAIFDKMKYGGITDKSDDIVTVMLTWKPYEEHITDFENTEYYKQISQLYDMLTKYVRSENIVIVAHPKVEALIKDTPMYENMWHKPIFELIKITKLLITDYSSVCYHSFYRGAGVIFYQYDLDTYEENCGKLIPTDDEYIGERTYTSEQLEKLIDRVIENGHINLEALRTDKFVENYNLINEWNDGDNILKICHILTSGKEI